MLPLVASEDAAARQTIAFVIHPAGRVVRGLARSPSLPSDILHRHDGADGAVAGGVLLLQLLLTCQGGADGGVAGGVFRRRDSGRSYSGRKHGQNNCNVTHGGPSPSGVGEIVDPQVYQYDEGLAATVIPRTFGPRSRTNGGEQTFSRRVSQQRFRYSVT